jgi:hypothetical protein
MFFKIYGIVFWHIWQVKIDHEREFNDVNATSGNIGGD